MRAASPRFTYPLSLSLALDGTTGLGRSCRLLVEVGKKAPVKLAFIISDSGRVAPDRLLPLLSLNRLNDSESLAAGAMRLLSGMVPEVC
jgi:hypothetical protein